MKRTNLRIIGIEEEELQLKTQKIYSTKLERKTFPNEKNTPMKREEAYRTSNTIEQKCPLTI